ncbi:hypothetical protein [Pandoraea sp. XY-2]|uniref:hypothetical protein n=1 Tax=Pandoraea sp. XY-2 TaxID=2518599 RepID=UPI00101B04B5|nr:hypothetical protein [Pandoraea sp. XY-2]QBC31803.1 hypothetical protein DRB87_11105 [Pandoraea sp. XY-2]
MANMRFNALVAAFSLLVAMPSAFPAATAPGTNHDHSHGRAGAAKRVAPPQPRSAELDDQIAHLRAIRMRLSRAETPQARQALLEERAVVMQAAMHTMHESLGMPEPGAMRSATIRQGTQTRACREMTSQHLDLMQEMMQSMMGSQSMGEGTGSDMGRGMGSGMGGMMGR